MQSLFREADALYKESLRLLNLAAELAKCSKRLRPEIRSQLLKLAESVESYEASRLRKRAFILEAMAPPPSEEATQGQGMMVRAKILEAEEHHRKLEDYQRQLNAQKPQERRQAASPGDRRGKKKNGEPEEV